MTWAEYFALPGINWSALKPINDSPLHCKHALDHPRAETPSLALGRYVHTAVLQPDHLNDDFAIWEEGDRRGKKWLAFAEEHADQTIFKRSEIEDMEPVIDALRPVVAPYRTPTAKVEQPITWTDSATGLLCKSRPDLFDPAARLVLDLKTTRSVDVRLFGHDVARYLYHGQLAHYANGIKESQGWTPTAHILIAVESGAPYDTGVFPLDESTMEVGFSLVSSLLERFAECSRANHWPGRHPQPITLGPANLPPWIFGGGIPEFAFVEE